MAGENLFENFSLEGWDVEAVDLGNNEFAPFGQYQDQEDDTDPIDVEVPVDDEGNEPEETTKNTNPQKGKNKKAGGIIVEETRLTQEDLNKSKEEPAADDTNSLNSLKPYALSLKAAGILQTLNEEEFDNVDPEQHSELLQNAMTEELNVRLEKFIQTLPPDVYKVIQYGLKGIPLKDILEAEDRVQKYTTMTDDSLVSSEEMMRKVILEDRMARGIDREEALEEIESFSDLEKPAKLALKRLKQSAEKELATKEVAIQEQEKTRKIQNDELLKRLQDTAEKTESVIPGVKINKLTREKVLESMLTPVDTPQGKMSLVAKVRNENPVEFDYKLNYLMHITDNFKDFSKIQQIAKTDALRELQKGVEKNEYKNNNKINVAQEVQDKTTTDFLASMFGGRKQ